MTKTERKGLTVRLDYEELQEVRSSLVSRRDTLDKLRTGLEKAGLSTFTADVAIETLDRCRVAIGDKEEDMFGDIDKSTGEVKE